MNPIQGANFLYLTGFLRNWKFSHTQGIQNVKEKWKIALQTSFLYWPIPTVFGYHYFDFHMRIPFFNILQLIYAIGLSYINNNKVEAWKF